MRDMLRIRAICTAIREVGSLRQFSARPPGGGSEAITRDAGT